LLARARREKNNNSHYGKHNMPTSIKLDWTANPASEFVTKYEVFESVNGGAFAVKANATGNTATIPNVLPGLYRYKVRAVNFVGNGPDSAVVDGPAAPSEVLDVTLTVLQS
jgi:hypothetical protein